MQFGGGLIGVGESGRRAPENALQYMPSSVAAAYTHASRPENDWNDADALQRCVRKINEKMAGQVTRDEGKQP